MVLIVIASHASKDGTNARPGNPTICRKSRICDKAVRMAIQSLIESGELVLESPKRGTIPASYRINLPMARPVSRTGQEQVLQESELDRYDVPDNDELDRYSVPPRPVNGSGAYRKNHHEPFVVVQQQQQVSAKDEQKSYVANGHTNGNSSGKVNQGKHAFGDYHDYVNATRPEKPESARIGLASYLHFSGKDDEAVAAWLKSRQSTAKKPKLPTCPTCTGRGFNRRPTPTNPINNEICETCNGKGHLQQAAV